MTSLSLGLPGAAVKPYYDEQGVTLYNGDCRPVLAALPDASVHCCVTSPPYFGLRSYLPDVVRLRASLSPEQRAQVTAQLERIGVFPLDRTSV